MSNDMVAIGLWLNWKSASIKRHRKTIKNNSRRIKKKRQWGDGADPRVDGQELDPRGGANGHLVGCARGGIGTCYCRIGEVVSRDVTVARDPLGEEVGCPREAADRLAEGGTPWWGSLLPCIGIGCRWTPQLTGCRKRLSPANRRPSTWPCILRQRNRWPWHHKRSRSGAGSAQQLERWVIRWKMQSLFAECVGTDTSWIEWWWGGLRRHQFYAVSKTLTLVSLSADTQHLLVHDTADVGWQ